jgi:ribonuclease T1
VSRASARRARTAAALAVVLVLALGAVLVGLVGSGASGGSEAVPGGSGATARATRAATPSSPARRSPPSAARTTGTRDAASGLRVVALAELPREAQQTVALVDAGGPFPYSQDGVTFGNYERVLPAHPRGWYREYTVRTPGSRDRGPRRIVTGDDDRLVFYTADHYVTFVQVAR